MPLKSILIFFCLILAFSLRAQNDSIPGSDILIEDILQTTTENETADLDQNTLFEQLENYRKHPLDLNQAGREELEELQILSDLQITRFLTYRRTYGELLSLYELQAVPGFDLITIRQVLPFVKVGSDLDDFQESLGKMLVAGDNRLFLRWTYNLEPLDGSINPDPDRQFLGDPSRYYLRYRHTFENRLYYGITAEKDPGEAFFGPNNPAGFDYYSAHFYLRNYRNWLPDLALGDYRISLGLGLIAYSGFGYGKSADPMRILRPTRPLAPYTSVSEFAFFRGAAARIKPIDQLECTFFFSRKNLDARIPDDSTATVSSIPISGFHRVPSESILQDNAREVSLGGVVKWKAPFGHIGYNVIHSTIEPGLETPFRLYNQFYFRGTEIWNMSVDYDWTWKGLHGFGEIARDHQGALATTHGLLAAIHPQLDMALLYRNFAGNFQTLYGNAFSESFGTRNENGIYAGMTWRPQKGWLINAYYDIYQHPWLRFRTDAPSRGHDWLVRFERFKKRAWRVYLQLRSETKEINAIDDPDNPVKNDYLRPVRLFSTRLHFAYQVNPYIELRTRIGWNDYAGEDGSQSKGWMAYQDVIFQPKDLPLSFTTRFALFETDDFNSRFYNFENDLLYVFSIPAYYDRGSRFYFNLRWRVMPGLVVEGRYARLFLPRQETIGAGPYQVAGSTRSEVKAQVAWNF
jgi:hypothetical protein